MLLLILLLFAGNTALALPDATENKNWSISDSVSIQQDSIHLVEKGETLYAIALKYGLKVSELKLANNLNDSHIETGQTLILPFYLEEKKTEEDTLTYYQDSSYVVQKGDILSVIASKYELNTNDLVAWNKLESADKIYPKQTIQLYPSIELALDTLKVEKSQPVLVVKADSLEIKKTDTTKIIQPLLRNTDTTESQQPETTDVATNNKLSYDFTPSGIKTAINVFVLVLVLAIFIYNINK